MEEHFHIARLAYEGLRLLRLPAEHSRLSTIGYVCFGIAVNNLQEESNQMISEDNKDSASHKLSVRIGFHNDVLSP